MKKSISISILLISSLFVFAACGKTESAAVKTDETEEPAVVAEVADETTENVVVDNSSSDIDVAEEEVGVGDVVTIEPNLTPLAGDLKKNKEVTTEVKADTKSTDTTPKTTKSGKWEYITGYKGDGYGPGNKIRTDFDYAMLINDFVTDNPEEVWNNKGVIVTASNGVSIKALHYTSPDGVQDDYFPLCDGEGKDLEPNSPFMVAVNEFRYLSWDGQSQVSDFSASPDAVLPVTSFKKTSLDVNDASLQSFKLAMDKKRAQAQGIEYHDKSQYNMVNDQVDVFYDGIMEMDRYGGIIWQFRWVGDHWELKIEQNPPEYQWAAIKNVLHYLSPDGDDLYQLFYDDFYTGRGDAMPTFDDWYSYSGSQVLRVDTYNMGYCIWSFK